MPDEIQNEGANSGDHAPSVSEPANVGDVGNAAQPVGDQVKKEGEKTQEEIDFARRFTALTRKEQAILAQAEKIRGEVSQVSEYKKDLELIKTNPLKFLEKNGWAFNDLAEFVLNDQKSTPEQMIQKLQAQIEELKNEKLQEKESSKKQSEAANVAAYKKNLRDHLTKKADVYELLNEYESFDMVYEIMNEHYAKTFEQTGVGEELDIDKVADEVEKYLEAQLERATKTKKFSSRFAPSAPVKPEEKKEGTDDKSPSTLTNSIVSGAKTSTHTDDQWLDDDASKRRAAKLLDELWKRNKA